MYNSSIKFTFKIFKSQYLKNSATFVAEKHTYGKEFSYCGVTCKGENNREISRKRLSSGVQLWTYCRLAIQGNRGRCRKWFQTQIRSFG